MEPKTKWTAKEIAALTEVFLPTLIAKVHGVEYVNARGLPHFQGMTQEQIHQDFQTYWKERRERQRG